MDYKVTKTLSLNKVPITSKEVVQSLCSSCKTRDCTNRVEWKDVAIFGIMKKYKLLIRISEPVIVLDCQGYSM